MLDALFAQGADSREPAASQGADFFAEGPHGGRYARDETGEGILASKALPVEGIDDEEKDRLQGDADDVGHRRSVEVDVGIKISAVFPDVSPVAALERHEEPGQK